MIKLQETEKALKSLQSTSKPGDKQPVSNPPSIDSGAIKKNLMEHPELIPHEPVLGGTMGFYGPGAINVLNARWVLADYEDGHIAGAMLLEYGISDDGSLTWRVIDSYLK